MNLPPPLDFNKFVQESQHLLKPPVNNHCLYSDESFTVMAVGGPNRRTDYHTNPTSEYFYQIQGSMLLKTVDISTTPFTFQDINIHQGCMFLLPPNVPHNPVRFENTIGLVIERKRPIGMDDSLSWFCQGCRLLLYTESFYCTDLGTQLKPVIEKFEQNQEFRTCKNCGLVNTTKE